MSRSCLSLSLCRQIFWNFDQGSSKPQHARGLPWLPKKQKQKKVFQNQNVIVIFIKKVLIFSSEKWVKNERERQCVKIEAAMRQKKILKSFTLHILLSSIEEHLENMFRLVKTSSGYHYQVCSLPPKFATTFRRVWYAETESLIFRMAAPLPILLQSPFCQLISLA